MPDTCHCEERCDAAISVYCARNLTEIALSLRSSQ
jgi:hypothetical protein